MNFLKFLSTEMSKPPLYGWFHILFLVLTALTTVLLCVFCRKGTDKQTRAILLTSSIIMILFEVYKQIIFSVDVNTGVWDYEWYAFPFQFCSVPMYVAFIAGCCKKGKVQDALCSFLVFFGFVAGITTMLYPNTMFIETIGINIQTMVHHGLILMMSLWLVISGRVKLKHKNFLGAVIVFLVMVAIAMILNVSMKLSGVIGSESFNMFYISPYFTTVLPIFEIIQPNVPYAVFLLIYIVGFVLCAYIVFWLSKLIKLIVDEVKMRKMARHSAVTQILEIMPVPNKEIEKQKKIEIKEAKRAEKTKTKEEVKRLKEEKERIKEVTKEENSKKEELKKASKKELKAKKVEAKILAEKKAEEDRIKKQKEIEALKLQKVNEKEKIDAEKTAILKEKEEKHLLAEKAKNEAKKNAEKRKSEQKQAKEKAIEEKQKKKTEQKKEKEKLIAEKKAERAKKLAEKKAKEDRIKAQKTKEKEEKEKQDIEAKAKKEKEKAVKKANKLKEKEKREKELQKKEEKTQKDSISKPESKKKVDAKPKTKKESAQKLKEESKTTDKTVKKIKQEQSKTKKVVKKK